MKENPNYYWQPYHQTALLQYITCVSATTSGITQHYLFNNILYQPLSHMASQALYSTGVPMSDSYKDYINDILIHLYTKILPSIDIDRASTFLHYAYTSCRNYIISNIVMKKNKLDYTDVDIEVVCDVNSDDNINYWEKYYVVRKAILYGLDDMIRKEKILNKTNTIFLLLLRQYLFDNNFNPNGFKIYVTKIMNIRNSTFTGVCSRLRISTKLFE